MACYCHPWKQVDRAVWERKCRAVSGPAVLRASASEPSRLAGRVFQASIEFPTHGMKVYPQGVAKSVEDAKRLAEDELERRFCSRRRKGGVGRLQRRRR